MFRKDFKIIIIFFIIIFGDEFSFVNGSRVHQVQLQHKEWHEKSKKCIIL